VIKVVHVNDKLSMDGLNPSSVAHLLGDWIPLLRQHGVACTVCTLRDPDPGARYLVDRNIDVRRFDFGRFSPRNLSAIAGLLREQGADIAHLHGFASANFGRIVARRLGIANVVHEHATLLNVPAYQRLADRLLRRWTDAAIAVSDSVREFMIHVRSVPPERIHVIGNGVDANRFGACDEAAVAALRQELGVPDDHRLIGVVTRFRAEKGTEHFLRSAPQILGHCPSVTFLIAGNGPLREPLRALSEDLEITRCTRFLGFRSDVPTLLGALDVLVIPSLTEGFPLSLLEGMAAGCAIVATAVGGMPEVARDGEDVLFVPPEAPGAIARRTVELLEHPDLAARMAGEAVKTAAGYSVANTVRRLADLYAHLTSKTDIREGASPTAQLVPGGQASG
jgi:glycosyltransferase involved in cell wall biosynthesis